MLLSLFGINFWCLNNWQAFRPSNSSIKRWRVETLSVLAFCHYCQFCHSSKLGISIPCTIDMNNDGILFPASTWILLRKRKLLVWIIRERQMKEVLIRKRKIISVKTGLKFISSFAAYFIMLGWLDSRCSIFCNSWCCIVYWTDVKFLVYL